MTLKKIIATIVVPNREGGVLVPVAFVATLRVARPVHVASIDPRYRTVGLAYDVAARIRIVFPDGSPVSGATVKVRLTHPDGTTETLTGLTGEQGAVVVARRVSDSGTYWFTVLGVSRPRAVYDPAHNVETSDSVTIP